MKIALPRNEELVAPLLEGVYCIENDQTIFSPVTAGNVKFAVSQIPNSHPFNF